MPSPVAAVKSYREKRADSKSGKRAGSDEAAPKPDPYALECVSKSERAISGMEPIWEQAKAFFGNDQYVFVSAATGNVDRAETREGGAKPAWRQRLQSNRLTMQIVAEASLVSGRTPAYEVTPVAGNDPQKRNQARLAERALLAEHQRLQLDVVCIDAVINSINTGCGFTFPYWDSTLGNFLGVAEDKELYEGDIKVAVLDQSEVLWEQGQTFQESSWHCVRKAMDPRQVQQLDGYTGPETLKSDARSGWWERPGGSKQDLVFVYTYLERPSKQYEAGRLLTWAGGHQIREPQDYPRQQGLAIHELPWIRQPGKHRHLGAGEQLVDLQRMINRIVSQIVHWRNLVLRPQMIAPKGSMVEAPTEEDGIVYEFNPVSGMEPKWRELPDIPQSLFADLDRCYEMMDHILGQGQLPAGLEAASAIEAVNAREQTARGVFIKGMSAWWASQGRHILELIKSNYNEPRLLELQGRRGIEMIEDFVGHQLGPIGTLRVTEASIEPRTRQAQEAKIMMYAQNGWIDKHQAMAAINGGTAEALIDSYELDVQRQYREINDMEELASWTPDQESMRAAALWRASGQDANAMPPQMMIQPPFPYAEDYDDHTVHLHILRQWMKTREFELQPEMVKQAARNHQEQHMGLAMMDAQRDALLAGQMAQARGMQAATRPPNEPQPGDQQKEPGLKTQLAGGEAK